MPVMFAVRGITPLPSFIGDGSESDGTQLITDLDPSTWSAVEAAAVAGATDPNGSNSAFQFRGTTADDRHLISPSAVTISANTPYTFSIYAKQNQYRYLTFLHAGVPARVYAYYDLQSPGAVTDSGVAVAGTGTAVNSTSIQAALSGFYKCSMNFTIDNSGTSVTLQICLSNVATFGAPLVFNSPQFAGANNTDNLTIWRPKLAA